MPGKLNLNTAEQTRVDLTVKQQKQIRSVYESAAANIAKQAEKIPLTTSSILRQQYLSTLQGQITTELDKIRSELGESIKGNMGAVSDAVIQDNVTFLQSVNMPVEGAFSRVSDEVIRSVTTGQLYDGNWSLSRALWKDEKRTQQDVQSIVAQGIAQNKSAYDIAKDLEKYVNPSARKDWDWSKVYPGTKKQVDYNAQRLARTMVSHAYQQAFVRTTQNNPFVTKYQWIASGSRVCPICEDRDGQYYAKDDLPLDHPNGMCTFVAVIEDSMEDIADRIADWVEGGADTELDEFAKSLEG